MIALLLVILADATIGDDGKVRVVQRLVRFEATVLDVFDGDRMLLSIGSTHGLRKGFKIIVSRDDPGHSQYAIELVEVGESYSVARAGSPFTNLFLKKTRPLQVHDAVSWYSLVRTTTPQRLRPMPEFMPPFMQRGGAIIDLTR